VQNNPITLEPWALAPHFLLVLTLQYKLENFITLGHKVNLMPYRRKIRRATMGKDPIKKSGTLIASPIGPASAPNAFTLITTTLGRNADGDAQTIRDSQNTETVANVGDIVKYINIHIQTGARDSAEPEDDTSGWLEWAIIKYKEAFSQPTTTNLGVKTLGDVCTQQFRGDCLLTGNVPVGGDTPNNAEIQLKVPKANIKQQLGSKIVMFVHFRSVNTASTASDLNATILSFNYKLYV